ncbi:MAG: PIN domain-containing protein [Planctomycetes bacterium]|nr:PIN domain-containing protein [Planctomycetota bacterium]
MKAVDTNILVYAVDEDEPVKRQEARGFLRQLGRTEEPLLMWQVAAELLACLRRWEERRGFEARRTRRYFDLITSHMRPVLPRMTIADVSFDLRDRYSLSHWDSMLLAACMDAGVETLYSEDLDDGMTYDSVTVVNPFTTV